MIGNDKLVIVKSHGSFKVKRNPSYKETGEYLYIDELDVDDFIGLIQEAKELL